MKCPICGASLDENVTECYVCGFKLEDYNNESTHNDVEETVTCPVCGATLNGDASFCLKCGTKIGADIRGNFDETVDDKSKQTIEKGSSESGTDLRSSSSSISSSDNGTKQKDTKPTNKKSKQRRMGLIIAIVCIIIAVCIVAVLFLTGVIGSEGIKLTSKEESSVADGNEQSNNVAPNSSYIGYWNISGNEDEELTITNVIENTVEFSLYFRGVFTLDDAVAYIDENDFASFACTDGEMMMAGDLIFYDDYIVVDINQADMDYINTGAMVFDERHLSSWHGDSDENVNSSGTISQDTANLYVEESYYDSYYILPDSSTRLLDYNDIRYLTKDELRLARNEIYARHGRKFDDQTLQAYFNSQPWYTGTIEPENFTQDMLSSIERTNIAFIESYE